jgi:ATP synthase protein I
MSNDKRSSEQGRSSNFKDFDARLKKLREDSGLAKDDHPEQQPGPRGYGAGVQVGIEMIAGTLGGGFIGYLLDRWLGTWPFLFLLMFFAGAAAGMLNAYRYIQRANEWQEPPGGEG